jgi:hypothetical protein
VSENHIHEVARGAEDGCASLLVRVLVVGCASVSGNDSHSSVLPRDTKRVCVCVCVCVYPHSTVTYTCQFQALVWKAFVNHFSNCRRTCRNAAVIMSHEDAGLRHRKREDISHKEHNHNHPDHHHNHHARHHIPPSQHSEHQSPHVSHARAATTHATKPCAVQVVRLVDMKLEFDMNSLGGVLLQDRVKNLPVVVISVAGTSGVSHPVLCFCLHCRKPMF